MNALTRNFPEMCTVLAPEATVEQVRSSSAPPPCFHLIGRDILVVVCVFRRTDSWITYRPQRPTHDRVTLVQDGTHSLPLPFVFLCVNSFVYFRPLHPALTPGLLLTPRARRVPGREHVYTNKYVGRGTTFFAFFIRSCLPIWYCCNCECVTMWLIIFTCIFQVLRFHDQPHVDNILRLCTESEKKGRVDASAEGGGGGAGAGRRGRGAGGRNKQAPGIIQIDPDTAVMPLSRAAIFRAAGAACFAVDEVREEEGGRGVVGLRASACASERGARGLGRRSVRCSAPLAGLR